MKRFVLVATIPDAVPALQGPLVPLGLALG